MKPANFVIYLALCLVLTFSVPFLFKSHPFLALPCLGVMAILVMRRELESQV